MGNWETGQLGNLKTWKTGHPENWTTGKLQSGLVKLTTDNQTT